MSPDTLQHQLQLQAMRPNGQDADDPRFASALAAAAADPELRQWHSREQGFDRAFAAGLAAVEPPPRLHATLLAGARASRHTGFRGSAAWKGLAAAIVLLLAGAAWLWLPHSPAQDPLAAFRAGMIQTLEGTHSLDHKTSSYSEVRAWLASRQGTAGITLPPGLCDRETIGCKVFEWNGARVTLICFRPCPSGDPQSASAHLFVLRQEAVLALLAAEEAPLFAESQAWASAAWKKDGHLHLLVSRSAIPHLRSLFDG